MTSFHHQPEAQHPKSSAIHKLPADYPIYWTNSRQRAALGLISQAAIDPERTKSVRRSATVVLPINASGVRGSSE